MDTEPDQSPDNSFNPFDFVIDRQFAHPEIDCELSEDSKRGREAYEERLKQRFVKFPYLTGIKLAKEFKYPALAVMLELAWCSYAQRGRNPITLSSARLEISRHAKRRGLMRLKKLDIIRMIQRKGKSPLIQLNWLPLKD